MEEEAEKLKELQNEVEKQMNMSPPPGNAGPVIMSIEEKMEADARSIYVGNVCMRALIGVGGALNLGDYLIGVLMETFQDRWWI